MVTHFSFGSFFDFQGCSTSPFFTRLEWKYRDVGGRTADDDPKDEAGREVYGVENGFALGIGEMSSPNGLLLLSGVSGRTECVAVEPPLPLCRAWFSMLRCVQLDANLMDFAHRSYGVVDSVL